ncbi:pyrroloquinoline quinone biosynthesis peptide chaperone PqqD [Pseudogulbenkiania sp. MAI-1]|uniref:pyrroloquinoline quinone biosynthesis peptide chaperone PqqD n=1 Tax=Pseudogulbenkiania sp. MAI-1 TaxID=990370 RepID=UPI00045E7B74|nr:pyrroloquinoline quinone biosynthesis peptide chaperone PqqD [Pseudogulbenkiania sp. MAI-1]
MLTLDSTVRLAPGTRLQHDKVRERWVLLGPERMLIVDDMARLILERSRGQTVAELCQALATEFDAPLATVETDVLALFATMSEKGFLRHD